MIEALAVTDYYTTDTYEEVVRQKTAGRLPNVKFLLPNIERRLDIAAKKDLVNLHLLVNHAINGFTVLALWWQRYYAGIKPAGAMSEVSST